ncbi:sodium-coupled monocarboxylate transporter 2-like [Copidosoma floridanum]|uniref:sodium-coupled monocarboxylate transporter 2-like n=1 Tax=Copidosoma floridanum TaxID=29053 RepID=UPI0006C9DFBA|nr:sodium-coupled monocarboxylate transporter 2-like [Copidosoma floridanum]
MEELTFGWIDYTVFSSLLGISIIIGIYFGFFSKQDTVHEYIYAGKTMSYLPVAISGLSSFLSGITYLGFTTEIYLYGSQYVIEIIGAIIASILATHLVLPVFFKLQLLTVTEYLELRFSKAVRKLCSVTYVVVLIIYCSIIIYAPAIAFSQLTGIELHLLTLVICTICIFYTSLGGVKAVVWTDTFQFIFTFVGFVSILIIGVMKVGGFSNIWNASKEGGRIIIFNMNPSIYERSTFFTVLSSVITLYLGSLGVSQKHVQKLLTIHEEKEARKALWAITLGSVTIRMMCIVIGLTICTRNRGQRVAGRKCTHRIQDEDNDDDTKDGSAWSQR